MNRALVLAAVAGLQIAASGAAAQSRPAVVELQTNLGTVAVELDYARAPITSDNFVAYVSSGFYRNTLIHRVIADFVIQGGGFNRADGVLKPTRPAIVNEANNGLSNLAGTIAMARTTDPNSATSQWFINLVDNLGLDYGGASKPGYAVFGRVVKGMEIVRKIGALPTFKELPFTAPSSLVWIDIAYANETWNTTVSRTRITISPSGSGTVTSVPAGIDCGTTCRLSQPVGAALQLKATAASGYGFGGWRGDCQGERATLQIDTTKGNHNCTAQFNRLGPSLQ